MSTLIDQIQKSNTWQEIHAQPHIWRSWSNDFSAKAYRSWIAQLGISEVWFCRAGTSAYIGHIIAAGLPNAGGIKFQSIASTDLVARARYYLQNPPNDLLIVNFGRSGNSSETVETLSAIEVLCPRCQHRTSQVIQTALWQKAFEVAPSYCQMPVMVLALL